MSRSSPRVFPWSFLWLASLATLLVQSVLSSSYSSSTYQRSADGGKRPGFMERTLVLLDVNTRSPIRVLNDNFLSLQLDPSIIKDGWLDFLRYQGSPGYFLLICITNHFSNVCFFFYSSSSRPRCQNCHGANQSSPLTQGTEPFGFNREW